MPTYRSINIALHSQFDLEPIPEYHPPPLNHSPTTPPAIPPLINDATSTCSVHIPSLPGSHFWITYSVSPPVPAGHFFLFKLFIDGAPVVSWSTGQQDQWKGKTMFGLFDAGDGKGVEKRVFCFCAMDTEGGVVEIRAYRASGRRRVEREMSVYRDTGVARGGGGVSLVSAGRAGAELPKRFYRFALIDPVDQPFATFRYYYRTWEQLRCLGLLDVERCAESEENDMPVIEPEDGSRSGDGSKEDAETVKTVDSEPKGVSKTDNDGISIHDWGAEKPTPKPEDANKHTSASLENSIDTNPQSSHRDSMSSGTYMPLGAPPSISTGSPQSLRRRSRLTTNRLSVPPSIKFDAPDSASRPLPLPQKNSLTSSTAYRPHPAYPVEEWTVRTPSPMRDGRATPPLAQGGAGWMGVISSAWRRRVSSAQATREEEVDGGVRSVSY